MSDPNSRVFIFSLDLKEKFVPMNSRNLIYCNSLSGPTFGGGNGNDIFICNNCNSENNSHSNFPESFNKESGTKWIKSQDSFFKFSGATNGIRFRVLEYEVFKVCYN